MSHSVSIYKSSRIDYRMRVRWGCKHGRPRGRGRKAWRFTYYLTVKPDAWKR